MKYTLIIILFLFSSCSNFDEDRSSLIRVRVVEQGRNPFYDTLRITYYGGLRIYNGDLYDLNDNRKAYSVTHFSIIQTDPK